MPSKSSCCQNTPGLFIGTSVGNIQRFAYFRTLKSFSDKEILKIAKQSFFIFSGIPHNPFSPIVELFYLLFIKTLYCFS